MEKLTFSVDSALLSELGEKLVESVHIALVELVKNAYDADASSVVVKFSTTPAGTPEIEIQDNGTGMTFEEVHSYWMRIATTNKVNQRYSRIYGRPKTGAKGIGRFCCRRLGTKLSLQTIAKKGGKYQKTIVDFPWVGFKAGTNVTDIVCEGHVEELSNAKTGTVLIITGAPLNEWSARGFNFIKRQLALLTANRETKRVGYEPDPGFNIKITDTNGSSVATQDLREEIVESGWATLHGHVDKNGSAIYQLDAYKLGKKKITAERRFPELSGVSFKVGIIPDEMKKTHLRNPKILSKYNMREILREWGGIQIRLNGFRVFPYGDVDWLNIERDRALSKSTFDSKDLLAAAKSVGLGGRAALYMLSHRSYFGQVELPDKIAGFEPKANREGFLDSPAIASLREFVRYGVDWSAIYRSYFAQIEKKESAEKAKTRFTDESGKDVDSEHLVERAIDYIQKEVDTISELVPAEKRNDLKNVIRSVKTAKEAIINHESSNKEELRHLRLIASASSLILIFSHEVKSLLGMFEASRSALKPILNRVNVRDRRILTDIISNLEISKKSFSNLMEMTLLIGVDSKTATEKRLALHEHIAKAVRCFALIKERYDIDISYEKVPTNFIVGPILEAELYAILINLLSNSVKAIIAKGGKDKRIQFEAIRINKQIQLAVKDTGIGLSKDYYEEVFVPFVADPEGKLYRGLKTHMNPEDRGIVGTGSGLGLAIVRDIVRLRKGSINFKEPKDAWKANLEVVLP